MSIVLENVNKSYLQLGAVQAVVNNLSLEINTGELFVLLGASGSGKSTLLRLIAGLVPMDRGRIWLHGRDVTARPPQQRNTGFVFQDYSLFQHMTVGQNIEFGLSIRHVSRQARRERIAELLRLIELEGYENRLPSQLSGGQQQRVALARALAFQPEVLLLDEPFGALDAKIRSQLRRNLHEIQKTLNITTILVTHDQDEAFELADRIGVIERGSLIEVGTPTDLYRHPRHRFTATFLGNANLLPGHRNSHHVFVGNVALPVPPGTEHFSDRDVEVLSRPEDIEIGPAAESIQSQLIGRGLIQDVTFAGALERVTVRLLEEIGEGTDTLLHAVVAPDEARANRIESGQVIWIGLKNFHLLA